MQSRFPRTEAAGAPAPKLRFGIVLMPRFTLSALSGFIDPIRLAADDADRSHPRRFSWTFMTPRGASVQSSCGLSVVPTRPLTSPAEFDYIVVVGGVLGEPGEYDRAVSDYLRRAADAERPVVGLCTGVFAMAEAGLLKGATCCLSWFHADEFRERYDDVEVDTASLYQIHGPRITCAGGVGAAHLALALLDLHAESALAEKSARILFLQRAPSREHLQPAHLRFRHARSAVVRQSLRLIEERLGGTVRIEEVASAVGLSRRSLERRFLAELSLSPHQVIQTLRLDRAAAMIAGTDMALIDVALDCGYANYGHFVKVFQARFAMPPSVYRRTAAERAPLALA
ncbi:helix-turn-helix domain-containing protein [Kaustia mangrovi]|uniref:Helix-turn-helix domain-containing protein n=1 Tax=Kaustia mangrovi TaxID=2593653 RepID=A0A7S8C4G9_9HYPH|nr:helix-turn-helix domain-containing protein [Kaustia mangrovi]QPC43176.1 helix-turn-helix domain-containing protein [Kaustia mangrovi]